MSGRERNESRKFVFPYPKEKKMRVVEGEEQCLCSEIEGEKMVFDYFLQSSVGEKGDGL